SGQGSQQYQAAMREAEQRDFEAYVQHHNSVAEAAIPEMHDHRSTAMQREAANIVTEMGLTVDDLRDPKNKLIYSAPVQKMIAELARGRIAARTIREHAKPVLPVVRPGTSGAYNRSEMAERSLGALNERLDRSSGHSAIRAAAQLYRA